jgi:hypothetical protein
MASAAVLPLLLLLVMLLPLLRLLLLCCSLVRNAVDGVPAEEASEMMP